MISRNLYLLLFLAKVAFAAAVDIKVTRMKAIGSSGNRYRLTGRCEYNVTLERPVAAEAVWFTIQLDRPSSKFQSRQVTVLSANGTAYLVSNTAVIDSQRFRLTFKVILDYNETAAYPEGTCSQLRTETEFIIPGIELLQNNDMESDNFTDNWFCRSCTLESSNDSYSGEKSVKVTNRNRNWKGLAQWVNLTAGSRYQLSGHIKLLSTENDAMYHNVDLRLECDNDTEVKGGETIVRFGSATMVQPNIWTEVGAVVPIPEGYSKYYFYWQVDGATVDYLVDDMSMREIPDIIEWKLRAKARIEQIRKANLSISVSSANPLPADLSLEVNQKRSEFAFGATVGAEQIVDETDPVLQKYQEFFYNNFEWGTIQNSLKWKPMEKEQGVINYEKPMKALKALTSKGIRMRAHNVFWGFEKNTPAWVVALNRTELLAAMSDRINGLMNTTKGYIEQWAVNNENQHGDMYERKTGDANITMQMFRDIHAVDPSLKLFLNDFEIIETRRNQKATAVKEQARFFKAENVSIYGIGIQSHIKNADVDVTSMQTRLNKLDESGLAIWVTELTMEEWDEHKKARGLEDLLTLYFSHPSVEGIMLRGFWDGNIALPNMALIEGSNMTANAAGLALLRLYREEWRTNKVLRVKSTNPIKMRAFKGEYSANLKSNDTILKSVNFTLGTEEEQVAITLP